MLCSRAVEITTETTPFVFGANKFHVGTTATQLDALFPGRVIAVNKDLPASLRAEHVKLIF